MTSFTTFYLSRMIGKKVRDPQGKPVGIVKDLLVLFNHADQTFDRPLVIGIKLKRRGITAAYSFQDFRIRKWKGKIFVKCHQLVELAVETFHEGLWLVEAILDKQIVDLNGRKLVRVNDVRLVSLAQSTHAIAVDIGMEGLLRRIGISKPIKWLLSLFSISIPSKFILWEDVEAVDFSNLNIKLSKSYTKLQTLHPSDLADIIEELGKKSSTEVFSALDEERAADVMEELEPEAQVHLIENLPVEKVADVLEKMPADEVADILDALEEEKAELLLKEMESDSSEEVRELLEYPQNTVGSIMSTDVLSFNQNNTVDEVIRELRIKKPEDAELYNLFVTDEEEELVATFSLRDLVVSEPDARIGQIMRPSPVYLYDDQEIDEIAEIISKYSLLAIPVVDAQNTLQGMVVIDDVVEDLINKRRTNK
jgi:CBS domain-containing protein/sporulation protein YlmC with PRC-barrel domain